MLGFRALGFRVLGLGTPMTDRLCFGLMVPANDVSICDFSADGPACDPFSTDTCEAREGCLVMRITYITIPRVTCMASRLFWCAI